VWIQTVLSSLAFSVIAWVVLLGGAGRCYSVFVGLAGSPAASRQLLASLAKSSDVTIRSRVAQNPLAPGAVAEALANDPEASVRMGVHKNTKLSHATLERLLADPDPKVRQQANAAMTGTEP
jgi:hypothetical protein